MRRRIFQLLTLLSLLLALATAWLWARSIWVVDVIDRMTFPLDNSAQAIQTYTDLRSERGTLQFNHKWRDLGVTVAELLERTDDGYHVYRPRGELRYQQDTPLHSGAMTGQFAWSSRYIPVGNLFIRTIGVPHWFVFLLFSILPLIAAIRRLRRQHMVHHYPGARPCPDCGYDCRASPVRCPECGRALDESSTAAA